MEFLRSSLQILPFVALVVASNHAERGASVDFSEPFKWQKTVELEVWSSTDSSLVVVDGFDSTAVRNLSGSIDNGRPV
jgi:hypothetical protein